MKGVIDTAELTDKQRQFIELRRAGKTYKEISEQLGISKGTCSNWNKSIFQNASMKAEVSEELTRRDNAEWVRDAIKALEAIAPNREETRFLIESQEKLLVKIQNIDLLPTPEFKDYSIGAMENHIYQLKQQKLFLSRDLSFIVSKIAKGTLPTHQLKLLISDYFATLTEAQLIARTLTSAEKALQQRKKQDQKKMHALPTGSFLTAYRHVDTLRWNNALDTIEARDKLKNSHSQGVKVTPAPSGTLYAYKSDSKEGKHEYKIFIPAVDETATSVRSAEKIRELIFLEINKHISYGELHSSTVVFPVSRIIEEGIYKDSKSAINALEAVVNSLITTRLNGKTIKKKRKGKDAISSLGAYELEIRTLVKSCNIRDGLCYLEIEDKIHWGEVFRFFTVLPDYYFRIKPGAARMLLCISLRARQKMEAIKADQSFTISARTVFDAMCLPLPESTTNNTVQIKNALYRAIEGIEKAHAETYGNGEIEINIEKAPENCTIKEFLSQAYLRVHIGGDYAKYFCELQEQAEKDIAAAKKNKKRIESESQIRALAKIKENSMKTAEATGKS